jgi:hypothetical protein
MNNIYNPIEEIWRDNAACKGISLDVFYFDTDDNHQNLKKATDRAKSYCKTCKVAEHCLAYALNQNIKFGVWGGFTSRERATLRKLFKTNDYKSIAAKVINQTMHVIKYKLSRNEL